MRGRVGERTLSAMAVVGVCCGEVGRAVAFAPSRPGPSCQARTVAATRQSDGRWRAALGMAGTKRPRSADSLVVEDDGETQHLDGPTKPKIKFDLLPDFMQKDPLLVTKQKWMEQTTVQDVVEDDSQESKRKKTEMMAMSAVSLALAIGVVYALASSAPMDIEPSELNESENVVRDLVRGGNAEQLEIATRNIMGTVLPQSAEDVIAVSIGEGIAGAIGAFATWLLGLVLNFRRDEEFIVMPVNGEMKSGIESTNQYMDSGMGSQSNVDALVTEAVADGDYFLTRAAAQPLFEALGIPIFFASLASVLIATVPYEAVKLTSQKRRAAEQEEILLQMLLDEEESRQRNMNVVDKVSNNVFEFINRLNVRANVDDDFDNDIDDDELLETDEQPQSANAASLDYVELFADITKWLEYDVLISNYRGILELPNGQMLTTGWESAIFGLLAALSSQLYTDVLYLYSDFGNPRKREMTLNRSVEGWASVYATKCLSAATLFGVYEAVRAPASRALSQLVSGGVGGCVGSKDFDLCMETYLIDNPASATLQADFRAFVVSTMDWMDQLSYLLPLNDQETLDSFFRGAAVSWYSVLGRIFNM